MPPFLWRCWLGDRKGIRPVKTERWGAGVVICLERGADLHVAQLMPLPLTVSCFSKIQIGFAFLVLAHLDSPGKMSVKRVCVCVCVCVLITTKLYLGLPWRFDLYQRPSSEEVVQFFLQFLHIRKDGRRSVNWDNGSYTLSHRYDRFLAMSHHYLGKNWKKTEQLLLMKVFDGDRNVKVNKVWLWLI